jgi:hypothetical protein
LRWPIQNLFGLLRCRDVGGFWFLHRCRDIGGFERLRKGRETHRCGFEVLPKIQTDIPDPLIENLPTFLTTRGTRAPAIRVLLYVLIPKSGLKGTAMQIQIQHISSSEGGLWCGGEKEFIDRSRTQNPNGRFGSGGGRMRCHDQAHTSLGRGERNIRAIKEGTTCSALRVGCVMIWWQAQTSSHGRQIKQTIVFASHDEP